MRTRLLMMAAGAVLSLVVVGSLAHAQRGGGAAAQGEEGGNGRAGGTVSGRGAYEPTLWLRDEDFLRWPFSDPAYQKIDGFKIKDYVNEITAISRKSRDDGNQY